MGVAIRVGGGADVGDTAVLAGIEVGIVVGIGVGVGSEAMGTITNSSWTISS